jgi:hypothetical protein
MANIGFRDVDSFVPNFVTRWNWGITYTPRSLYQLHRWMGEPQSLPGYTAGEKNFLPLPIRTPDLPAPSLVSIPTTPSRHQVCGTIEKSGAPCVVESSWNLTAHGDARVGKWRGIWRMEWVASTLTLPRNVVYPALLPLMRTPRLPAVEWTDAPAYLNGLVRFGERRNLVSVRVPSGFEGALHLLSSWWRVMYHLLSAVHDCLSNKFASIVHIWRPSLFGSQCDAKTWR